MIVIDCWVLNKLKEVEKVFGVDDLVYFVVNYLYNIVGKVYFGGLIIGIQQFVYYDFCVCCDMLNELCVYFCKMGWCKIVVF